MGLVNIHNIQIQTHQQKHHHTKGSTTLYVIVINQLPGFVCNIEAQIPRDECFYIAYKVRDWLITIF